VPAQSGQSSIFTSETHSLIVGSVTVQTGPSDFQSVIVGSNGNSLGRLDLPDRGEVAPHVFEYAMNGSTAAAAGPTNFDLNRTRVDIWDIDDCGYSGTFSDDDDSVFESSIEWLAAEGITKGCNPPVNDMFCPDDFVTRGQMAAFLVRALSYTEGGGGDLFRDDDDNIFETAIDKLGTAGVTKGCNPPVNDMFCPDDFVTRGQMAAFLRRALG
jgi:hypothetical protein